MAAERASVLDCVRQLLAKEIAQRLTDRQLLERFVGADDQTAFEAVVRRHGPMVLRVCRRVLGDHHEAEDACQATFLVLARKAHSIAKRDLLSNWLYGIAFRTAQRAKADASRRRRREKSAMANSVAEPTTDVAARELCALLDEELHRLRDCYRAPLVLCYLEGRTRDQAARLVGVSLRTLERRLEQGRNVLRARLSRRGVTLSAALLVAEIAGLAEARALPLGLARTIAAAALRFSAGRSAAAGLVSSQAVVWAQAMLQSMGLAHVKSAAVALLVFGAISAGAGVGAYRANLVERHETAQTRSADSQTPKPKVADSADGQVDQFGDPLPAGALGRFGTVRFRHSGLVSCSMFSPDGKSIITAGRDGTMRQWDTATGMEIRRFVGCQSTIHQLAMSPDGKRIASAEERSPQDGTEIRLWDVPTAKQQNVITGFNARVAALGWAPDNNTVAVRCHDGVLQLFDATAGKEQKEFAWLTTRTAGVVKNPLCSVAFSTDGRKVAWCASDEQIHVSDLNNLEKALVLRGKEKVFTFVAFSADGKTLITGGDSYFDADAIIQRPVKSGPCVNTIALWDVVTGKRMREFQVGDVARPKIITLKYSLAVRSSGREGNYPRTVSWTLSADAKTLAVAHWDNTIQLWDLASGQPLQKLTGYSDHIEPALNLSFSPDGKTLAASGSYHAPCLLDVATGKQLFQQIPGLESPVWAVALSEDGKRLATAGPDSALILWDVLTRLPVHELQAAPSEKPLFVNVGLPHGFTTLAFSPNGRAVAAGNWDGSVHLWDTTTGQLLWRQAWFGPKKVPHITGVAFSPDGKVIAVSADHPAFLRLCDAAAGKVLTDIDVTSEGRKTGVVLTSFGSALAFSADGKMLFADAGDGTLRRWQINSGHELHRIEANNWGGAFQVAFAPNGRVAATAAFDLPVIVWNLETGQPLWPLKRDEKTSCRLAFSPDGRYLAMSGSDHFSITISKDKTIELLELASGTVVCVHRLPPATGVSAVTFSKDGRRLVTGMNDTTTLIWDVDLPPVAKSAGQLEAHWATLESEDAIAARRALAAMTTTPARTVDFLRSRLESKVVDRKLILQLVADLDSNQFRVREAASKKLKQFGPEIQVIFSDVLANNPTLEVRKRLEILRAGFEDATPRAEVVRSIRAVEVLERIGTPEAKKLLAILAKGAPNAQITLDAAGALQRLAR